MRQQIELNDRAESLEQNIKQLESVNKRIAKLLVEKEALTDSIIAGIGHDYEGQRTYQFNEWDITAKTPYIYSLNTKKYKAGDVYLDEAFNPIQESVSYKVNRELAEEYMNTAPASARSALLELITKKPGKASVTIGKIKA